jgi:MerR family copper efflux transcriptional regulator
MPRNRQSVVDLALGASFTFAGARRLTVAHTIGEAAKAVGVSAKAIRIWESKGPLPPAGRTAAGYRLFTDEDIEILPFIGRAKTLGLTLPEIKGILDLRRRGTAPCDHVTTLLDAHIRDVDR